MKKYQNYIIGIIVLLIGFGAGWFFKPSSGIDSVIDHSDHTMDIAEASGSDQVWTCSMHPQIRQNEPGLCPICEMDLIQLDNSMGNDDPTVLQMSLAATKLAQIETTIVGEKFSSTQENNNGISVEGSIEMDERSIKSQSSHIGGRVESMLINFEGEYVKAGQRIGTIYSTDILAASQELITAAQFEDRVEGIKEASIQKLKNWKITQQQIDQILQSGNPIETMDIYADHSGYVLSKKVSQGDYVKIGQSLYTTGTTSRLWLIFNVFETDMANIRIGQNVVFTTPALGAKEITARITYIDPILNTNTRTGIVRAETGNPNNQLKPGMMINGKINISSKGNSAENTISIPKSSVLWTGDKSVVYVKLPDEEIPSFQFREVKLGQRNGKQIIVKEGLNNGDEIVTYGAFSIDAAAQLNNKMSMMNRDVKIKSVEAQDRLPNYVESTPELFKQQLTSLAQSYIDVKNAFVNTNPNQAKEIAGKIIEEAKKVDMSQIEGDAHIYWMEQLDAINNHSQKITEIDDVESQRKQFEFLSDAMIKSIKVFGITKNTFYVQYCPMAFNNQGADWLSTEATIANPYFGDKMHKCGSIKDTLNF